MSRHDPAVRRAIRQRRRWYMQSGSDVDVDMVMGNQGRILTAAAYRVDHRRQAFADRAVRR